MRTLTLAAVRSLMAERTDVVWLVFLTISHAELTPSIRVVNNTEDIESNGETFIGFPFLLDMPAERENQLPRVQLTIGNVDKSIVDGLRALSSSPTIKVEIITSEDFDKVEVGPYTYTFAKMDFDKLLVTGDLKFEELLEEPYPGTRFIPNNFQGLF